MSAQNVIFSLLIAIGFSTNIVTILLQEPFSGLLVLIISVMAAGIYLFNFLIKNCIFQQIIVAVLKSLPILLLGFIPVIGWIIVLLYALYNIAKTLESIQELLPTAGISLLLMGLLVAIASGDPMLMILGNGIYVFFSLIYARTFNSLNISQALVKLSLMWVSVFLMWLLIASVITAIRNALQIGVRAVTNSILTTQNVSGYVTAGGTVVSDYQRQVMRPVVQQVITVTPGFGAVIAKGGREMAKQTLNTQTSGSIPITSQGKVVKTGRIKLKKKVIKQPVEIQKPATNFLPAPESIEETIKSHIFAVKLKQYLRSKNIDQFIYDFDLEYFEQTQTIVLSGMALNPQIVEKLIQSLLKIDRVSEVKNQIM